MCATGIQVLTVQDIEQVEDGEAAERVRAAAALAKDLWNGQMMQGNSNDSEDEQDRMTLRMNRTVHSCGQVR